MNLLNNYYITYINLDYEKERLQHTENQLNKTILKDQYQRFPAVNGRTLDIDLVGSNIITEAVREQIKSKTQKYFGISMTYGAIACALTHKLLWELSVQQNQFMIIFEDDIILHEDFDSILISLDKIIYNLDYDIVYLGYNEIPGFKKQIINTVLAKPSGLITGTQGYIVSPTGANKLLNTIFPLHKQIDSSIADNINKLNLYCSSTNLVTQSQHFLSRIQRSGGCINLLDKNGDGWYKLFI